MRPGFPADSGRSRPLTRPRAPLGIEGARVGRSIQETSVRRDATTATVPEARIRKRRIVERPRLFALLDESKAQVRMLIAPAGYGKTTLAEQWVARDGRVGIWYTARSASTDVAALALGIARAATAIIDDADHRLREHLRALPAPAENVQTLAEILSEDLAAWPANAWLVLDDYHEITPEPKAEDFVEALVALSPVQVPDREPRAPTLGCIKASSVRRRSRTEPNGTGNGFGGGGRRACWPSCVICRGTRRAGSGMARCHRAGKRVTRRGRARTSIKCRSRCTGSSPMRSSAVWIPQFSDPVCNSRLSRRSTGRSSRHSSVNVMLRLRATRRLMSDCSWSAVRGSSCIRLRACFLMSELSLAVDRGRGQPRHVFGVYRDRKDWDAAFELIKRTQLTELLDC